MCEEAKADIMDQPGRSGPPSTADLKAMFAELLDGAKQDILAQVKGKTGGTNALKRSERR